MPFKPSHEGEFPTLGWQMIDFYHGYCGRPSAGIGNTDLIRLYPSQAKFFLNFYRLDPVTGRRVYDRALWEGPRGIGKSPMGGLYLIGEALGPAVFDGWDADGQPVGRPWMLERTVRVQAAATTDEQVKNIWDPMLEMLRNGSLVDEFPGLDVFDGEVKLPGGGSMERLTSSATSVKGAPSIATAKDQTESWTKSNRGKDFSRTLSTNAGKVAGSMIEFPNAFTPGEDSVAEESYKYAVKIREGKAKNSRFFYYSREASEGIDFTDKTQIMEGLRYVYGDTAKVFNDEGRLVSGHVDLEAILAKADDPEIDEELFRRDYLNQKRTVREAFLKPFEYDACGPLGKGWEEPSPVTADDPVVLGFDGSRGRVRGVADATALVAIRVTDCLAWPVQVWEEPDGPEAEDWEVPEDEVEMVVAEFLASHRVVGWAADTAGWEANIARWEAKYGQGLKAGPRQHPIAFSTRMLKYKIAETVEALKQAFLRREIKHRGEYVMRRHVLNARVRERTYGKLLFKESPSSEMKIDAAYALLLAYLRYLQALSMDLNEETDQALSMTPGDI